MQTTQVQDAASQVNAVVDHLAAKLSVPVSHLWGVLMREAYVEGVRSIVAGTFCLIAAGIAAYLCRVCVRKVNDPSIYHDEGWQLGVAAAFIVAAAFTWGAAANMYDAVPAILNPEYVALQGIVGALR